MEASIQQVARLTGTTSRTLRHYGAVGLLAPSRVGDNGYRWYDDTSLVRLQRILLLRETGAGAAGDPAGARPRAGRDDRAAPPPRVAAQRAGAAGATGRVGRTDHHGTTGRRATHGRGHVRRVRPHGATREEVEERWGTQAYATSDAWWRGMSDAERAAWKARSADLIARWAAAAEAGTKPGSDEAQAARGAARRLAGEHPRDARARRCARAGVRARAGRHVRGRRAVRRELRRGERGATFVRDALHEYAARHL